MRTNCTLMQMLQQVPSKLDIIGKRMSNQFMKEVILSIKPVIEGTIFCFPEKFLMLPFWENPMIKRNNKAIKSTMYPTLINKVQTVGDFYKLGENT